MTNTECVDFKLTNAGNKLVVYQHEQDTSSVYKLRLFDENLEFKHALELPGPLELIASNGTHIFIISSAKKSLIDVYDLSLKFVRRVGQSSHPFNHFFCPKSIKQLEVIDDKYLLLDKLSKLRILEKQSGSLVKTFTISGNKLALNSREEIVSMDETGKQLTYYNAEDGSFIEQVELVNYPLGAEFFMLFEKKKGSFVFFDKKNCVCYMYC